MAEYKEAYGKTIQEAFEEFHQANPRVYEIIVQQVKKAVLGGRSKISIKQIVGWIRWEVYLKAEEHNLFTQSDGLKRQFKINDAYTSRYARILINEYPQYENKIELRDLRA